MLAQFSLSVFGTMLFLTLSFSWINILIVHCYRGDMVYPAMLLNEEKKVIMDWSEKSACTKMLEMFWNEMGIYRGVHYLKTDFAHRYRPKFYALYGHVTESMFKNSSYYKFKAVRNPWDRAVSSYNYIMLMNWSHSLFTNQPLRRRLQKLGYIYPVEEEGFSFEDYLQMFVLVKGTSFEKDESQPLDNVHSHRRSQSKPLENIFWTLGKGSPYNRIVHLENFEAEIALVNKETGMKFKFPKGKDSHESPRRKWIADVYVGNVKWNHLKNRIPSNYGQYYSSYTRDLVQRLYINDILIYNYSFPYSLPRG